MLAFKFVPTIIWLGTCAYSLLLLYTAHFITTDCVLILRFLELCFVAFMVAYNTYFLYYPLFFGSYCFSFFIYDRLFCIVLDFLPDCLSLFPLLLYFWLDVFIGIVPSILFAIFVAYRGIANIGCILFHCHVAVICYYSLLLSIQPYITLFSNTFFLCLFYCLIFFYICLCNCLSPRHKGDFILEFLFDH